MGSRHPQAEALVVDWLKQQLEEPVFTETDSSFAPPAFKVQVFGGTGIDRITRAASIELCAYAQGRGPALDLLDKADAVLMSLAANGFPRRYVDDVELVFYPAVEPYANTGLHQATATYSAKIRPQ